MGVCVCLFFITLTSVIVSQSKCVSEQPEGKKKGKSGHSYCYLKFYSVFSINVLTQKTDGAGLRS